MRYSRSRGTIALRRETSAASCQTAEGGAEVLLDAEPEAEPLTDGAVGVWEPVAEVVAAVQSDVELVSAAEPESEPVTVAEPEPEPEPVVRELAQVAPPAMAERPIELVAADEEPAVDQEDESDVRWDWTLEPNEPVAAADAEPVSDADQPEPVLAAAVVAAEIEEALPLAAVDEEAVEPVVASEEEVVITAAEPAQPVAAEEPATPAEPALAPPVFRPLTSLGPIVAPPPPMAAKPVPRIEFELPDAPPAFIIAPPGQHVARPVLPVGLFDGPGPAIRPCPSCALPVSAKAHFCRRCGSAQG